MTTTVAVGGFKQTSVYLGVDAGDIVKYAYHGRQRLLKIYHLFIQSLLRIARILHGDDTVRCAVIL